jgi:hypothetical protein
MDPCPVTGARPPYLLDRAGAVRVIDGRILCGSPAWMGSQGVRHDIGRARTRGVKTPKAPGTGALAAAWE